MRAAVLVLALTFTATAHAERKHWYGWQILIPDLAFDGLFLASVTQGEAPPGLIIASAAGILAGGPIVRLAHHQWPSALLSLGGRLGAEIVTLFLFNEECCSEGSGDIGFFQAAGYLLPVLVVQGVDIALAREPLPPPPPATAWIPSLGVTRRGGLALSWHGHF